jgi:hypothetical protein
MTLKMDEISSANVSIATGKALAVRHFLDGAEHGILST